MKALKGLGIAAAALMLLAGKAEAVPTPLFSFDIGGNVRAVGAATFDQATGLDFGSNGPTGPRATFGTDGGDVQLENPSAFLADLGFQNDLGGKVADIAEGTLTATTSYPLATAYTPFYTFTTSGGTTLSFNLTEITKVERSVSTNGASRTLTLTGLGTAQVTGYDDTLANFSLTTTNTGTGFRATFSSSVDSVPEPISVALVGAGLVGLGMVRRRKSV